MNIVRWESVAASTAEFTVDYGGKRARVKLEGLGTTGRPEETPEDWKPFYRERLKELLDVTQAEDTYWTDRGSE